MKCEICEAKKKVLYEFKRFLPIPSGYSAQFKRALSGTCFECLVKVAKEFGAT